MVLDSSSFRYRRDLKLQGKIVEVTEVEQYQLKPVFLGVEKAHVQTIAKGCEFGTIEVGKSPHSSTHHLSRGYPPQCPPPLSLPRPLYTHPPLSNSWTCLDVLLRACLHACPRVQTGLNPWDPPVDNIHTHDPKVHSPPLVNRKPFAHKDHKARMHCHACTATHALPRTHCHARTKTHALCHARTLPRTVTHALPRASTTRFPNAVYCTRSTIRVLQAILAPLVPHIPTDSHCRAPISVAAA